MTDGENQRQDKIQDQSVEISKLLAEMDQLFDGFGAWLGGQKDAESGGFYYAASSRRIPRGAPDIESTAQALNILERCDWLDAMSTDMKRGCIRFFQSKQEESSGYFYDKNPLMREDEVMVARAISYSLNALRKLGGQPLHALPYEAQQAPSYMSSPEDYLAWLKSVELTNSWRGCDRLSTSSVYVKQVEPASRRAEFAQTAFDFFANKQDPLPVYGGKGPIMCGSRERSSCTFSMTTSTCRCQERNEFTKVSSMPYGMRKQLTCAIFVIRFTYCPI